MLEISKEKETNFEEIFGAENYARWLKDYPTLKNSEIQSWLRAKVIEFALEGKDASKIDFKSYIRYIHKYCEFNQGESKIEDMPSELISEELDERNDRLRKYLSSLYIFDKTYETETGKPFYDEPKEDKKLTKESKIWLKKYGFTKIPSDVSIRNMIQSRIKGFFTQRNAKITYRLKARKSGANKNELYLDKDMIKQIQSKLESAQYRLINKFETQTGLRISDVLNELTSGNYKIEKYKEHYFIKDFKSQKEMVFINFLFFTTELTDLLISIYPESLITNKKGEIEFKLDLTKLFMSRKNRRIRDVDYLARIKAISKELGFNGNLKTHAFRKYFCDTISNMENHENKFNHHLEGREPNYVDDTYITSLKNLKKYYKKWILIEKEVCIDCIIVDNTNEEIVKHKTKIANLEKQLSISIEKNANLSLRLDKIEEHLKNLK